MRVLLLGATGNLGRHCVQALVVHKHTVTIYVRNIPKLRSIISPELLGLVDSIVEGDATDSAALKRALTDHNIEGIIDVAGNQVLPWKEYLLPKIANAVTQAAIAVGKERGEPLRAWITSGLGIAEYPGTGYLIQDYIGFEAGRAQHQATRDVVQGIPLGDLRWSLLCISLMLPHKTNPGPFYPLEAPLTHGLLVKSGSPPAWENTWLKKIPCIGTTLEVFYEVIWTYSTKYIHVADFLAEDLKIGGTEWVGGKVVLKESSWKKDV